MSWKVSSLGWIRAFLRLYPCHLCAQDFIEVCRDLPPRLGNRDEYAMWWCEAHNRVRSDLSQPLRRCELQELLAAGQAGLTLAEAAERCKSAQELMKRKAAANPSGNKLLAKDAKTSKKSAKSSSQPKLKDSKEESKQLSERRLKQYSMAQKGKVPLTVGLTGARCGDLLRGLDEASNGDVANVVLRLVTGQVAAPAIIRRSVEAELGRDALLAAVAKHFGISRAAAELRYNDFPSAECPNHQPLGSGCSHGIEEDCTCAPMASFVIVSQGVWQNFAEQHGNGAELQAMVSERRVVCWRDVLKLMYTPGLPEGKKLILRPRLFEIVAGPEEVLPSDPALSKGSLVDGSQVWPEVSGSDVTYLRLDDFLVRVPRSSPSAWTVEVETICEALEGLVEASECEQQVRYALKHLKALSLGALKSCVQKLIRFHASMVQLGSTDPTSESSCLVPSCLLVAVAMALLFASRGGFSPELQLFTRGCTAALKRLAVILLEDAWVEAEETPQQLAALLVLGLVTQRMHDYEPPRPLILAVLRLAAKAQRSKCIIAWRSEKEQKGDDLLVSEEQQQAIQISARLLRILRSFPGDMDMFDIVAQRSCSGFLQLLRAERGPKVMPLCHIVDQHTFRGIGHLLGEDSGGSFTDRFRMLFEKCTGCNPRLADLSSFESRPEVSLARFAQGLCLNMALQRPRKVIPVISEGVHVNLELDTGVLPAAVGPLPVTLAGLKPKESEAEGSQKSKKRKTEGAEKVEKSQVVGKRGKRDLLVLLGLRCPEDEVVMQKPVRATRDLFGELTDQERADAVQQARSQSHRLQSPLLQGLKTASFSGQIGQWMVDGQTWTKVLKDGVKLKVPLVSSPFWCPSPFTIKRCLTPERMAQLLRDDAAVAEAMNVTGVGMVSEAQQLLITMSSAVPHATSLRAVALLRQQYSTIAMPTPSLQGTADGVGLAAYEGDWWVYRFLVLVSRVMPVALRPIMPPNFQVLNPILLRILEKWIMEGVQQGTSSSPQGGLQGSHWKDQKLWKEMESYASPKLMEHQREAIDRMMERDQELKCGGHFLIMDTGHGKTVTSLLYAYRWLCQHGRNASRILWITPAGTVENLVKQLRSTWHCPTHVVPRISQAKKPKVGETLDLVLKDFMVNVIHADHLRTAIDKGLAVQATSSVIIFDEVDEMYAPTLRTSAARRLCQNCPKFVAQTATPMRKNESQLLAWLADTCAFPVDKRNWLVAASGMVSMQLELSISAREEEVLVPMVDAVRDRCRHLLASHGAARWLEMARVVQEHTDAAMVQHADRSKHPYGGVLLVADSRQHAEKLMKLSGVHLPTGDFASLEASDAEKFAVVVVTKDKDRGYNSARRLGVLVTGAYPGNAASRHQLRGRLRRLGQRRKEVRFVTVCMENSILHLLHQRHSAVDTMNISLEQLGQRFSAEVLNGLRA
eukprot:s1592_g19.t1